MRSPSRTMQISVLALLLLILSFGSADCKSLTVCKDGCEFVTINAAIDAADPEDTIEVQSGIYHENIRIKKSLTLIGKDTGEGKPVIDAGRNGSAVSILSDGITIAGFNLTNALGSRGDFYAGIRVWGNNTVLKDNLAFYNQNGILMTNSINGTLENNSMLTNKYGMRIETSRDVKAIRNEMKDNNYGLLMVSSEGCLLRSNIAKENDFGIRLNDSENNTLVDNLMEGNIYNFGADEYNNMSAGNLVDSKYILNLMGLKNEVIDPSTEAGTIYLWDCENVTVRGLKLSNSTYGIYLRNSTGLAIEENNLKNVVVGIALIDSFGNLVSENQIDQSSVDGVELIASDNTRVENNYIENYVRGLFLLRSANNDIVENTLLNGSTGVYLDSSWSNWVSKNSISLNRIGLKTTSTEGNNITLNNMIDNAIDISRKEFDNDTLEWMDNKSIKEEVLAQPTAGATGPKKKVKIESYPENAAVLIDGKPAKWKTPGEAVFTKPGSHHLELRLGQKRISREIVVPVEEDPEPVFIDFESLE